MQRLRALGMLARRHECEGVYFARLPYNSELAAHLRALAERGAKVRVVAHSLGCRQVIEAASCLPPELRPEEIHLCAPAVREDDVAEKLACLARGSTFLYYTEKDRVLDLGFTPLARGRALGFAGPREAYRRLTALDVSELFDFFVHGEYKLRFYRLVPEAARRLAGDKVG